MLPSPKPATAVLTRSSSGAARVPSCLLPLYHMLRVADILVLTFLAEEERRLVAHTIQEHGDRLVGFHQVRTRKSGPERHIDLHLVVAARASVEEAHDLCTHLENDLHRALRKCTLNIHVEPCHKQCQGCALKCSPGG